MPVSNDAAKKARNALLKHKVKMTVGAATYKSGKDDTFVTGGGLPGRGRTAKLEGEEE